MSTFRYDRGCERELARHPDMGRALHPTAEAVRNEAATLAAASGFDTADYIAELDAVAGDDQGRQIARVNANHWTSHWWEFGTRDRYHKAGRYTGRMQASAFLRRAADNVARRRRR